MIEKTPRWPRKAFMVGLIDGLTSVSRTLAGALAFDAAAARDRSTYRGEGIGGDMKAVGRDMRRAFGRQRLSRLSGGCRGRIGPGAEEREC